MRRWLDLRLWLILGLFLRFGYLTEQQTSSVLFYQPLLDEQEMVESAQRLVSGAGFGAEPLFKAPLYPAFLAMVMKLSGDGWFFAARLIQHLLGVFLIFLAWDCARKCASSLGLRGALAGAAAALAIALNGPLIRLEDSLLLDFLAVFLQSLMLWALIRTQAAGAFRSRLRWAAVAGVAAAAAWLDRPTLTPVLPLLALWIVAGSLTRAARRRRGYFARSAACACFFLAIPALAMSGVWLRNLTAGGEAMLLPWQGGYNFYYANAASANGRYYRQQGFSLATTGNPTRELSESAYRSAVADGSVPPPAPGTLYVSINRYWFARARAEIAKDPARWIGLMGRKVLWLFTDREIFNFEVYEIQRARSNVLRWLPVSFGIIWPLALPSLALILALPRRRNRWRQFGLIGLTWLYLASLGGAIALYYVSGRLRMPLVFPAAILADASVAAIFQGGFLSSMRWPGRIAASVLFLAGAAMSWGDWGGVRSENLDYFEHERISNAAWREGSARFAHGDPSCRDVFLEALAEADACERSYPGYPTAQLLRGQALYSLGRIDDAAAAFVDSMQRMPADPVAPYNLGVIQYYDRPNPQAAAADFEEAARRQPAYSRAAWMAVLARLRTGQLDLARKRLTPYLPFGDEQPSQMLLVAAAAYAALAGDQPLEKEAIARLDRIAGGGGERQLADELAILRQSAPTTATARLRIPTP